MSLIQDEAVVLGRLDYSESSQVLVLFTREHGKVCAIAKGIKRGTKARFAGDEYVARQYDDDLTQIGTLRPTSATVAI